MIDRVEALQAICKAEGVRLQAAALQFPSAHPASLSVVSGARTAEQVEANVAWFEEVIPASFWVRLQAQGLIADGVPVPV